MAVDDVTFDVARSEILALVGPNGAGKTTAMRMLAGLIAPTEGSVAIDGVSVELAKEALALAAAKLPIKTRFVQRIVE